MRWEMRETARISFEQLLGQLNIYSGQTLFSQLVAYCDGSLLKQTLIKHVDKQLW